MLFQRPPIWPTSGSGSQPGQYTAASMRSASFCQPAGWAQTAGFAAAGAATGFFALPPQPETTSTAAPSSAAAAGSDLIVRIVNRASVCANDGFRGGSDVRHALADERGDLAGGHD